MAFNVIAGYVLELECVCAALFVSPLFIIYHFFFHFAFLVICIYNLEALQAICQSYLISLVGEYGILVREGWGEVRDGGRLG